MIDAVDRLRQLAHTPVVVAPMAGGPSTPELVVATGEAGALGFLAAGYKTAEAMEADIEAVRRTTSAAFGVNLFVPGPSTADPGRLAAYVATLEVESERLGAAVGEPAWDDDNWSAKLETLLTNPPAMVSFTFGCPPLDVVDAFHERDTLVVVTVTRPDEALEAAAAGADLLCAQGFEAGGHRGSFSNDDRPGQDLGVLALIAGVARVTELPQIAAGGISDARSVKAVLAAGAVAAQAGTAFLRCPESGASAVHKAALADPQFSATAITRAFSGRPVRGLVNRFMVEHREAPAAYPQINNATRPLRAAAAAHGDPSAMSLWAGQGYRSASDRPAGEIIEQLARAIQ
jgi:nitronate monooxygenase